MARPLALCLAALLAACGGGGGDGGTPNPGGGGPNPDPGGGGGGTGALTVTGPNAFTPAAQVGATITNLACARLAGPVNYSAVLVRATAHPTTCSTALENKASSSFVLIRIWRERPDGPADAIAAGDYPINAPPAAGQPTVQVNLVRTNASCGFDNPFTDNSGAVAGTVKLTSVGETIAGSVDATLATVGARVTGTFSVPSCTLPTAATCELLTAGQYGACAP
jgi:hypothetical protein